MARERAENDPKYPTEVNAAIQEAVILREKLVNDVLRMAGSRKKPPRAPKMKFEKVWSLRPTFPEETRDWLDASIRFHGKH